MIIKVVPDVDRTLFGNVNMGQKPCHCRCRSASAAFCAGT